MIKITKKSYCRGNCAVFKFSLPCAKPHTFALYCFRVAGTLLTLLMTTESLYAAPLPGAQQVVPSNYIVVFNKNVNTDKTADELTSRYNIHAHFRYRYALRGIAVKMPPQLAAKLASDPRVAYIEPDILMSLSAQTLPTGINRINADLDPTANIDNVDERVNADIAILDTGIDLDHPDLNVFNYAYCKTQGPINANCINGDLNANDINSHGTHVAGITAALDNNSGVVGVAPGARLWAVKVLEDDGVGAGSQIIAGVDYVAQHALEIEVANMSLTGDGTFQALDDAINGAVAAGVVFVLAAGNSHKDVSLVFPAGNPNAITVSALEDYDGISGGLSGNAGDDTFAYFSNYGSGVDIMAPGVSIRSTVPGGGLGTKSGTSMASPHVAGAAALYMSQYPNASPATVKAALINTGDLTPCSNNPNGTCAGTLDDPDGIQEPLLLLACDDSDGDGICDDVDNCPLDPNPLQIDTDLDTAGNACDLDDDDDGLTDIFEAAIGSNPLLVDTDGDTISDYDEVAFDGNAATYTPGQDLNPISADTDNDLLLDNLDPIPLTYNFSDGDLAPLGSPDGIINAADYLIATRLVLGGISPSDIELSHGDLYPAGAPDGIINTSDLILIRQLIN